MAGPIASRKPGTGAVGDDEHDPFVSPPGAGASNHHRYSTFDTQLFAMGPGASPDQARRALEAHLADTDRRMEEAGKLGTALLQQRKQLAERLKDVEQLQAQGEMTTDLRKKLADMERDYNEVARESARAFLPKQRIPSNEAAVGSPFAPEGKGGRRSVSPSKFESQATGSPTKLSVPNRKLRNQPTNRIHDIEFAAEISTSLISQVRNLQALLAEREEELRDLKVEKSKLELEAEGFQQRVKTLDESEHRYKDENWNLETQIHELIAIQKEAAEREKKLTQTLSILQADKNSTQRELDEIKVTHAKLVDEHVAAVKQHDIELGTVKRSVVMAEGERSTMQRKIEDLTSQNQELAKAFSMQRGRILEREAAGGMSDEDFETAADNVTPEHSPPPSPVKGTPRHSMMESETLKTSLHHAQRTIQSLRTNVHREKTEKLELKRMLQDARDELEKMRGDPSSASGKRSRKVDSREFKKPLKPSQLGGLRHSRSDIYLDDPNWEDQGPDSGSPVSPSRSGPHSGSSSVRNNPSIGDMPTLAEASDADQFETAHETSDAAFETANERATETEDFQTGAEELSDDDDAATETEDQSRGLSRMRRPPSLALRDTRNRYSFHSTASTSADEEDYTMTEVSRTPTVSQQQQRMRLRVSRGALSRRSRQASEEPGLPGLQSSPMSYAEGSSIGGTPQPAAGQSLFAELGDLDGSEEESVGGVTPSRRSVRSVTPASIARRTVSPAPEVPPLPKAVMVDAGMMTDPVDFAAASPTSPATVVDLPLRSERPMSMDSVIAAPLAGMAGMAGMSMSRSLNGPDPGTSWLETGGDRDGDYESSSARPLSTSTFPYSDSGAQYDADLEAKLALFPSPPTSPPRLGDVPTPILAPPVPVQLMVSDIFAEDIEPRSEPEVLPPPPPALNVVAIQALETEPISEPETPVPDLSMSYIHTEHVEPISEPVIPPPVLTMSSIAAEHLEPVSEPETPLPALTMTTIQAEHLEPVSEPEIPLPAPPALMMSSIQAQHLEPVHAPEPPAVVPAALTMSSIATENVAPIAEPQPLPPSLGFSTLHMHNVDPIEEPIREIPVAVPTLPPPSLGISAVHTQLDVEPIEELPIPPPAPAPLSLSGIQTQFVEPLVVEPPLAFSQIRGEELQPRAEAEVPPPALSMSSIAAQGVEPISPVEPKAPLPPRLSMAAISSQHVEPIAPVERPLFIPSLGYSTISSLDTEPISPRSPKRNAFILPRDEERPRTPNDGIFGSVAGRGRAKSPSTPIIAEDETRQSPSGSPLNETPESQRPFRELSTNTNAKPVRKQPPPPPPVATVDQSAQTSLTADAIDQILNLRAKPAGHHRQTDSFGASVGTPGTVRVQRSQESLASVIRHAHRGRVADAAVDSDAGSIRRPGSAGSGRLSVHNEALPPLPPNHRQAIEAARTGSSSGGQDTIISAMGPPPLPASAYKNAATRPRTPTPSGSRPPMPPVSVDSSSVHVGTPTPKAVRMSSATHGTADVHVPSPARTTARSRQSSVSSFASEINTRFNMHGGAMGVGMEDPHGFGPNTDPRMIQAITQTMIGEYLWKYTRKAGRGEMSENRHRRYFWVHPYTRTLYWSDRDPSIAAGGRSELRAKSVPIEAVRVVTDDNPMPPGLHRKSLIILSPGRSVKFTCTTGQRHETWFNALSYLLLRTNAEGQTDAEEMAGHITSEDVDEFNPQFGRRPVVGTRFAATTGGGAGTITTATRPRPPPSLSSYNSRTTRGESPAMTNRSISLDVPTLTPTHHKKATTGSATPSAATSSSSANRPPMGTLSRLSGYWRSGTFSSTLRGRSGGVASTSSTTATAGGGRQSAAAGIYEASVVHDSAEDLRLVYEQQDRESDRLENVRACCDGKHDVGTLSRKGGSHSHNHHHHHSRHPSTNNSAAGPSTTPTPMGTVKFRA